MEFSDVTQAVKAAGIDSLRTENPDFFEAVLLTAAISALTPRLVELFGPAAYPGGSITPQVTAVIENFGGIMKGQTLYCSTVPGKTYFLMLWPWSDKEHVTVKTGWKS